MMASDLNGSTSAALPGTQYAYRALKSAGLIAGSPVFAAVENFQRPEGAIRTYEYSADGRLFAFATLTSVQIIDASTAQIFQEIPVAAIEIAFSPKGTQIMTWSRAVQGEPGTQPANNLRIWDVASGTEVASFLHKAQIGWQPQFVQDESRALRLVTNEIQIYDPSDWSQGAQERIKIEGVTSFALSPGRNPSVAAFVAEKKGVPASVKVYNLASVAAPSSSKSFFKADRITIKWNATGTAVLFVTQTDVDKTGKSYYGETNLYLMSAAGDFDCKVVLDKEGGIHDFAWSPGGKEFIVVYGYMPAKAVLYDHRVNVVHDFGTIPRNFCSFNPQGRLVCIAGFGNLAGQVDIWDRRSLKKVASLEAPNSSVCEWSPDGRFLLCATLSPRLRVDNGIRIYHYSGALIHMDSIEELYAAGWRPASADLYPFRSSLSPAPAPSPSVSAAGSSKAAVKPMGAYRPPGARGMAAPALFRREDEGGAPYVHPETNGVATNGRGAGHVVGLGTPRKRTVPGAAPSAQPSHQPSPTLDPKARRKKRPDRPEEAIQLAAPVATTPPAPATPVKEEAPPMEDATAGAAAAAVASGLGLSPADKKRRALQKKLTAIEQLKSKLARGEPLEITQRQKIDSEAEVRRDLELLAV